MNFVILAAIVWFFAVSPIYRLVRRRGLINHAVNKIYSTIDTAVLLALAASSACYLLHFSPSKAFLGVLCSYCCICAIIHKTTAKRCVPTTLTVASGQRNEGLLNLDSLLLPDAVRKISSNLSNEEHRRLQIILNEYTRSPDLWSPVRISIFLFCFALNWFFSYWYYVLALWLAFLIALLFIRRKKSQDLRGRILDELYQSEWARNNELA